MLTSRSPRQVAAAVLALGLACPAFAQAVPKTGSSALAQEMIMSRSGELVAPWKYVRACRDKALTQCSTAVVNSKTREIAQVGGQWSSRFEKTGDGQEVKRAESAKAKAARLKGEQEKP